MWKWYSDSRLVRLTGLLSNNWYRILALMAKSGSSSVPATAGGQPLGWNGACGDISGVFTGRISWRSFGSVYWPYIVAPCHVLGRAGCCVTVKHRGFQRVGGLSLGCRGMSRGELVPLACLGVRSPTDLSLHRDCLRVSHLIGRCYHGRKDRHFGKE